jgi:hypothetical protein
MFESFLDGRDTLLIVGLSSVYAISTPMRRTRSDGCCA